jgi:hypothetical protein
MKLNQKPVSLNGTIVLILVMISAIAMEMGYTKNETWYRVLVITVPLLLLLALVNILNKNHTGVK